jgi:hypothetical protein
MGKMTFYKNEKHIILKESTIDSKFGKGTLILTNQNLSFVRQRGLLSKRIETLFVMPVENISNVKVSHQKLHVENVKRQKGVDFTIKDPKGWMLQIRKFKEKKRKTHSQSVC